MKKTHYLIVILIILCTLPSCFGWANKGATQNNSGDTCEEISNITPIDGKRFQQTEICDPFNIGIDDELSEKLKSITISISDDTIAVNVKSRARFEIEKLSTKIYFSRNQGIGDFIIDYLSTQNIDIKDSVSVLNYSSFPDYAKTDFQFANYMIANSMVYVGDYLFLIYKQNIVLIYKKPEAEVFKKIALPFDYEEWMAWQGKFNRPEMKGNKYSYSYNVSDNKWFEQLFSSKKRKDTVATEFYILDNNITQFQTIIARCYIPENSGSYFYKILNTKNEKIISEISIGSDFDENEKTDSGKQQGFLVTKDLKIYEYKGDLEYSAKEDRVLIINKKSTGLYQINEDGTITKLEN